MVKMPQSVAFTTLAGLGSNASAARTSEEWSFAPLRRELFPLVIMSAPCSHVPYGGISRLGLPARTTGDTPRGSATPAPQEEGIRELASLAAASALDRLAGRQPGGAVASCPPRNNGTRLER